MNLDKQTKTHAARKNEPKARRNVRGATSGHESSPLNTALEITLGPFCASSRTTEEYTVSAFGRESDCGADWEPTHE